MSGFDHEAREENIRMIRESAGFLAEADRMMQVRAVRHATPGIDEADWTSAVSLGWFGLLLPEARGGADFGLAEYCALCEEMGRGLMSEAFVQIIAIAPLLPDATLEALLAGTRRILPAWYETLGDPEGLASLDCGGRLTGQRRFVTMAGTADGYLVESNGRAWLVERDAAGLSVDMRGLQDGGHMGDLRFDGVAAAAIDGNPLNAREQAWLGLSSYLLGMAEKTFWMTRDYLGTRVQFDKPIGAFQALQHRMVDMYMQIQLARAAIGRAAHALDSGLPEREVMLAVSRAKARASDMVLLVTREAVQMHGGIGYTDDCDVGLFLRKAMVVATAHGSAGWHRRRFARLADIRRNRIAA